ncbi:MAG: hypothetical protein KIT84_24565 [Labilithrix sp.]|nr:hypothetical protein [Labilithrix sp.]MCW5814223.1 hypothetical protein [Labilithrix sp.]
MKRALVLLVLSACARPVARPPVEPYREPPRVVAGPLEARPLLGDLPARASQLGAGALAIVASSPMAEGERVGAFVEIPKDACLLAYARSSASLEDIDLAAFAEEGNPVAVDEGPDPKPTVMICPPHPDRVYVAAHAAAGEGLCVIAAQLVPRDKADAVARAANAHGASPKSPETWPGLDDRVRQHRAALGGTWEELRRVAVAVDSRAVSTVGFTIEENGCTDALVVPDEDVAVVDVDVLDADGRLVARAKETLPIRSVTVCSQAPVAGSMQVRPHVGRGLVAVVVSKSKGDPKEMTARPEVAWASAGQPLDAAKTARDKALVKAGYGAATSTQSGQLQLGRRATLPIDLDPNACTRVDVVAGAPLALVDGAIWDGAGNLLASGDGADGATLFACGKGKARLDLGTRGRPGPYAVMLRPERWKDAAFAAHPLAASRMLGRFGPVFDGAPGRVRAASLDAAKRYVQDANIPAGACLRVAAGVEGEGTGLELRIFDAGSGEELDRGHGQNAASARACAGASALGLRIEARATAGRLDAVLGERLGAR